MGDVKAGVGVRKLTQQFQQLIEQTSTSTDSKLQKQQTIQPVKSRDKSPAVQSYKPEQEIQTTVPEGLSKDEVSQPEIANFTKSEKHAKRRRSTSETAIPNHIADKIDSFHKVSTQQTAAKVELKRSFYRNSSNNSNNRPITLSVSDNNSCGNVPQRSLTVSDKSAAQAVMSPTLSKFGSSTFYAMCVPRSSRDDLTNGSDALDVKMTEVSSTAEGEKLKSGPIRQVSPSVKFKESVRRPRSPMRLPDPYQEEDSNETRSVADLISAFQGQSEARRKTILETCSFYVDIPKLNAAKYISRRESLSVENSNKITEHDSDGTAEPNAIELPQDPQILTINVLPEAKHTDAPQEHVQRPQLVCLEKPSWAGQQHVKKSGILENISEKERKMQEAMYEVISNEQMFYKSMDIVVNHFYHNLIKKFTPETHPHLTQPINMVFKSADKFLEISDKLLGEFDEKQADKVLVLPYFDILVKIMTTIMLKPFKRYSVMKHHQEQELENCRKDPEFAAALDALNYDSCTGGLTLDAFLLKPVQHATRYSLLMEAIVKRLDESDPRYPGAKEAHKEARSFAEMINSETNLMEFLFELTSVLAGLRDVPSEKREEVDAILSEAKKGVNIHMYGKEVSFSRSKKGAINFKHSEKLSLFCWGSYLLITKAGENGHIHHFISLTDSIEGSDGLDIMSELQIASFPKGMDLTKLLLLKYFPIATSQHIDSGSRGMHLLYCTAATKKKWKETIASLNSK